MDGRMVSVASYVYSSTHTVTQQNSAQAQLLVVPSSKSFHHCPKPWAHGIQHPRNLDHMGPLNQPFGEQTHLTKNVHSVLPSTCESLI